MLWLNTHANNLLLLIINLFVACFCCQCACKVEANKNFIVLHQVHMMIKHSRLLRPDSSQHLHLGLWEAWVKFKFSSLVLRTSGKSLHHMSVILISCQWIYIAKSLGEFTVRNISPKTLTLQLCRTTCQSFVTSGKIKILVSWPKELCSVVVLLWMEIQFHYSLHGLKAVFFFQKQYPADVSQMLPDLLCFYFIFISHLLLSLFIDIS